MMDWNEYVDKIHIENTSYILLMPIIIDLFSVVVRQYGLANSSTVTMMIYGLSYIFILFRLLPITTIHSILNDFLWLIIIYIPFVFNYVFFVEIRYYLMNQEMLLIYVFFLPMSVFTIRKIKNWQQFMDSLVIPGYFSIGIATVIMLFLNYQRYLVYMGFSYALLPFICNFYRMARMSYESSKKQRWMYFMVFFVGMIIILAFGARAAVAFGVLYIIVFELIRSDIELLYKLVSMLALIIITFLVWKNINDIANWLSTIAIFKDSYFLKNLLSGNLLESESRDLLYAACKERMGTVGFSVNGFFSDRQYCIGYAYPHNILYEIIMTHGWFFGPVLILCYAVLLIKRVFSQNLIKRDVVVFLVITMFARYFISGSYLIEGRFWIMTALFFGLASRDRMEDWNYMAY